MSKVATYLRGHITGEVSTREDVRAALASDTGVLSAAPDMVIYPRTTNDIRKVARFSWQLAEKGHVLPLTARGAGTDSTGAAIGKGTLIVMPAHMNKIFEYEPKQKLVRLQSGATASALSSALALQGTAIMPLLDTRPYETVGGAISGGVGSVYAGKYGTIANAVEQLEVVLANGDLIQTGRISKKELNRRKGVQGFEGDIYRGIDGILEEYADTVAQIRENDVTGYNTIADVKQKDGSFDLTPLFVGAQGTLGIITEMILRAEFRSTQQSIAALVFENANAARDALDELAKLTPSFLEYFDAQLYDNAATAGRTYAFYVEASASMNPASVVLVGFDDFNARKREKHLKKLTKQFGNKEGVSIATADGDGAEDLFAALDVVHYTALPDRVDTAAPAIFSGFYIPPERREDFSHALDALAEKEHLLLPLASHVLTNSYSVYPSLSLHKVSDKQKIFKLLDELTKLVLSHGGTMIAEGGEGRLKARAVYTQLDEKTVEMYEAIRKVCDPYGTLNPGVKQSVEVRTLAGMLRSEHDAGQIARFGL